MSSDERNFAGTLVYWVHGQSEHKHHSSVLFTSKDDLLEEEKNDGFGEFISQALADDEDWGWLTGSNVDYVFNFSISDELTTQHDVDTFKLGSPYHLSI